MELSGLLKQRRQQPRHFSPGPVPGYLEHSQVGEPGGRVVWLNQRLVVLTGQRDLDRPADMLVLDYTQEGRSIPGHLVVGRPTDTQVHLRQRDSRVRGNNVLGYSTEQ